MSGTAKVIVNEVDKTQRVSGQSTASVGGVIPTARGPLEPTLISNNTQFYNVYTPDGKYKQGYDLSYLEIDQYLQNAGSLYLNRAYGSPLYSGALIYDNNSPLPNSSVGVDVSDPNNFVFNTNNGRPLVSQSNVTFDSTADTILTTALFYNGSLTGDEVQFQVDTPDVLPPEIVVGTSYYLIKTETPNLFQLASSKNNAISSTPIPITLSDNGTGTSFTVSNLEVKTLLPVSNNSSFTLTVLGSVLTVSNEFYLSSKTGDPVILSKSNTDTFPTELTEDLTYYLIVSSTLNQVQLATSLVNAMAGTKIAFTTVGTGTSFVITNSNIPVSNILNQPLAIICAKDPGDWGNLIQIKITNYSTNKTYVRESNAFAIDVYYNNIYTGETFVCCFDPSRKNMFGVSMYLSEILKGSNYITAVVNPYLTATNVFVKENLVNYLTFARGVSDSSISEANLIAALQPFRNTKKYNIKFLTDFGITLPGFQKEIINICEARGDCGFILSVPFNAFTSPTSYLQDILEYKNATLNSVSNYGVIFANPIKITDVELGRNVWITSSGIMTSKYVNAWDSGQPWIIVAGNKSPLNVLDVYKYFTEDEESVLVDNGINPIRFEYGGGIKAWGERTLQIAPTAFDRFHVRILFNYIKPALKSALEPFLFLLNDLDDSDSVMSTMTDIVSNFLDVIKALKGIYGYEVVCNSTNNTVNDVVNSRVNMQIYLTPVYGIEKINVGLVATNNFITFTN